MAGEPGADGPGADGPYADGSRGPADGPRGGADGGAADGGIFVPPPTCVNAAQLPAWRQGMTAGQWLQLPSADIALVKPAVQPGGGWYGRLDAWNGFAADTVNSVLYLGGAGGHGDYAGNEVYTLDLNAATPQWVIRQQPSPASAYVVDQPYYTDGRPSPTHTYYTAWFVEQRAKFFRFAGAATWGTGNGNTRHIDSWNPTTNAWDPAGTNPDMGPSPTYDMPTAKSFTTGDVYQLQFDNRLYRWNQQSNTVTALGEAAGGKATYYELHRSPLVVDTINNRLIFFVDGANPGSARIYDIAAHAWKTQAVGGPGAAAVLKKEGQGMAFLDACTKKIIFKSTTGGEIFLVDATTLSAEAFPTTGTTPPNPLNGVHTLFQYLPKLGGYAYQPTHASKLYFLATQ